MDDEPLFIQDLNTRENVKRARRIDILTGVLAAMTFFYAILLASSHSSPVIRQTAPVQVLSIIALWCTSYLSWLNTHTPLIIYRDRVVVMDQVIPLSQMRGISKKSKYGEMIYKIKYQKILHLFCLPMWYKCLEGSPQSIAFDALMSEYERLAGRSSPVFCEISVS